MIRILEVDPRLRVDDTREHSGLCRPGAGRGPISCRIKLGPGLRGDDGIVCLHRSVSLPSPRRLQSLSRAGASLDFAHQRGELLT
jgi:hypothetical protein